MPVYEVKNVGDEPRAWTSSHGGSFLSYKVDLESDGHLARGVEWNKKDTSPSPSVGEQVAGILEDGKYGEKFKIDYEATKELGGRGSSEVRTGTAGSKNTGSKGDWQPESERDPERSARILRQHSQGLAVQILTAMGAFDGKHGVTIHNQIESWTDYFDKDVNKAGEAAAQGAGVGSRGSLDADSQGVSPATTPAPEQRPADDTHQFLCTVIETAGLAAYPASKLADFIVAKLNPEQRKRAETGLSDFDTQAETLAKLKAAYEQAEGPLPEADTGLEDLPF